MGNSVTALNPPAAWEGKNMIWHMLKFRTREGCEDKPQLVLLVEHFKAKSECSL